MAAFRGQLINANVATGTSTLTILQLNNSGNANLRVRILEIGITLQGTSTTAEPIEFQVLRQTTAGAGSSSVTALQLDDSIAETLQVSGLKGFSSEPTAGDILKSWMIHPQAGIVYPIVERDGLIVGGADRLGVRCVSPAATVDCSVYIDFEE